MKDSTKLLNFNVNRELKFQVFRKPDIAPMRSLSFNSKRELLFSAGRELGFGKRGVVFRGYICPVCKAPVARDAPHCDECGVKFEQAVKAAPRAAKTKSEQYRSFEMSQPKAPPKNKGHPPKSAQQTVPPPKAKPTFQCPVCNSVLYVGTSQCPGCMTSFISTAPPQQTRIPPIVSCARCNYQIPASDMFCRRCGSPRPSKTANPAKSSDDGIVSWDEYSKRKGG